MRTALLARPHRLWHVAAVGLPAALVLASAPLPAAAAPAETTPASRAGSSAPTDLPDVALAPAGEALLTERVDSAVAPGVTITGFERLDARGWLRGDLLVADLGAEDGPVVDYLGPEHVSDRAVLSQQAERAGAVAAVNGDFFDINDTGAPLGIGVGRSLDLAVGEGLRHGPAAGHNASAVIGADGLGAVAEVLLEGTASDGETSIPLSNLNSPTVADGGVGLYTPQWGAVPLARTVDGVASPVREVVLDAAGVVVAVVDAASTTALAPGSSALVGRGAGAAALAGFEVGEEVAVEYGPRSDVGEVAVALSGNRVLARDGEVLDVDDTALHPRTAVGFSADGTTMLLLTVDGRQAASRGVTEVELGQLMLDLGADDVLNLDGGGSSTMLARTAGAADPQVVNSPSDGSQRATPNGLGLVSAPGSGDLTGFSVGPAAADDPDAGSRSDDLRVLTGLSRVVVARGHDEVLDPVDAEPRWYLRDPAARVTVEDDGTAVVTGRRPGAAEVVAARGPARGTLDLEVLGTPVRLEPSSSRVALAGQGVEQHVQLRGHDAAGWGTWVEPRDVDLEYDRELVDVVADDDGFRVTARTGSGNGVLSMRAAGLEASVAVSIGLQPAVVDDMDDAGRWRATTFPAAVRASAAAAPGREGSAGGAVALDYSLSGTTATRAAYLTAAQPLALPGAPQRLGAWVHGDGQGAWLRANVRDAAGGSALTVDLARSVDWTGWRYVETQLPDGLTAPVSLTRLYVVETAPNRQYSGRLVVDDITSLGPPAPGSAGPADDRPSDPVVVTDGTVRTDDRWTFAVLSDAQFTADAPEGELVGLARRTVREALATGPEMLVVNGDFVDRAFPDDVALARRVLDEEVGDRVPLVYVPGNHEASGPGDLSVWEAEFGEPWRTFDHRGTRFIQLDSSRGSLRAGGFDQLLELRRQLGDAETDAAVENVVVLAHHPVDDPGPTDASQLADRLEAELLVDWLADLRARTGKGVAHLAAHAGTFTATREDGVLLPITGNSGKNPSAAPGDGGFTGWTLVGVQHDPVLARPALRDRPAGSAADAWLRVENRPHVDALELDAPAEVAVGSTGQVSATVVQDGRRVPVAWPVSADWSGARGLHVGDLDDAPRRAALSLDPSTGRLTALRAGTVEVSVTVNGVTQTAQVIAG